MSLISKFSKKKGMLRQNNYRRPPTVDTTNKKFAYNHYIKVIENYKSMLDEQEKGEDKLLPTWRCLAYTDQPTTEYLQTCHSLITDHFDILPIDICSMINSYIGLEYTLVYEGMMLIKNDDILYMVADYTTNSNSIYYKILDLTLNCFSNETVADNNNGSYHYGFKMFDFSTINTIPLLSKEQCDKLYDFRITDRHYMIQYFNPKRQHEVLLKSMNMIFNIVIVKDVITNENIQLTCLQAIDNIINPSLNSFTLQDMSDY